MRIVGNNGPDQSVITISQIVLPLSNEFFDRGRWLHEQGWTTGSCVQKCIELTPYYNLDSYNNWLLVLQQNAMEAISYKTHRSELLLNLKTIGDLKFAETEQVWDQFAGFPLQSLLLKERCVNKSEFVYNLNKFRQCLDTSKKSDLLENGVEFQSFVEVLNEPKDIRKFIVNRIESSLKAIGIFRSTLKFKGLKFWEIELNEHYSLALALDTITLKPVGGLDFFVVIYNNVEADGSTTSPIFNRNNFHVTTLCDWFPISEPFTNKSVYSYYLSSHGLISGIDSAICMFKNLVSTLGECFNNEN